MRRTIYFRTSFSKSRGVAVPGYESVARFRFAPRGRYLARFEGGSDLAIIPLDASQMPYCGQDPERTIRPIDTVLETLGFTGSAALISGGEESQNDWTTETLAQLDDPSGDRRRLVECVPRRVLRQSKTAVLLMGLRFCKGRRGMQVSPQID